MSNLLCRRRKPGGDTGCWATSPRGVCCPSSAVNQGYYCVNGTGPSLEALLVTRNLTCHRPMSALAPVSLVVRTPAARRVVRVAHLSHRYMRYSDTDGSSLADSVVKGSFVEWGCCWAKRLALQEQPVQFIWASSLMLLRPLLLPPPQWYSLGKPFTRCKSQS